MGYTYIKHFSQTSTSVIRLSLSIDVAISVRTSLEDIVVLVQEDMNYPTMGTLVMVIFWSFFSNNQVHLHVKITPAGWVLPYFWRKFLFVPGLLARLILPVNHMARTHVWPRAWTPWVLMKAASVNCPQDRNRMGQVSVSWGVEGNLALRVR